MNKEGVAYFMPPLLLVLIKMLLFFGRKDFQISDDLLLYDSEE